MPEIKKKYRDHIFLIVKEKNYQKIEEMFKRYYITSENIQSDKGDSLVTLAVHLSDLEMLRILLSKGLNPNTQNKDGDTPLHFAISMMNFKIADLLIHSNASESIKNNQGLTPWDKQAK